MLKNKRILWITLISAIVLISCISMVKHKEGFSTYVLQVTYTSSYCNGVVPPQELLDSLAKPRPYAGKKLYIKRGKFNSEKDPLVKTIITGPDGMVTIPDLVASSYYIVDEDRLHRKDYAKQQDMQVNDEACIDKWFKKPIWAFEVKADVKQHVHQKINFHKSCYLGEAGVPCVTYTGPQKP